MLWRLFGNLAIGANWLTEKFDALAERFWTAKCVRCGYTKKYNDGLGVMRCDGGWVCSNCYTPQEKEMISKRRVLGESPNFT